MFAALWTFAPEYPALIWWLPVVAIAHVASLPTISTGPSNGDPATVLYCGNMAAKRKPGTPAEYRAFTNVLSKALQVSHSELQARLKADKEAKMRKRKLSRASASRDSGASN